MTRVSYSNSNPAPEKGGEPGELFAAACRLLARGDSQANKLLPRLHDFPGYSPGWLQLGQTLLRLGQPEAANAAFDQALRAEPDSPQAVFGQADVRVAQGRPAAAAALLAKNRDRWPDDAELWHKLGRARYAADEASACAQALRRAVELAPGRTEAWFHLGLAEQDLDEPQAAARAYRRALEARPGMAEAALNLGIALQDAGDMAAALDAYAQTLRLRPAYFNRIAQALTSASNGRLWLDLSALRRFLENRA
jgi:cytochrome c-type biogenesis protein CcmH/NrfG